MVTTRIRQVRLLIIFMLIFATMFFWIMFDKNIPLIETVIGCILTGFVFVLLGHSYLDILDK